MDYRLAFTLLRTLLMFSAAICLLSTYIYAKRELNYRQWILFFAAHALSEVITRFAFILYPSIRSKPYIEIVLTVIVLFFFLGANLLNRVFTVYDGSL